MSKKRIEELESLRGIMSFIIAFFMHYNWLATSGIYDYPVGGVNILFEKGYYVVETFFVLSGFGMALGYSEKLRLQDNTNIISFLWLRMKKLWPIMTIALIITTLMEFVFYILYGAWFQVSEVTVYSFILSLLNVSSGWFVVDLNINMPLWYVSALMLDYIIYYVLCRISKKNKNLYIFMIFAFACWGLSIVITGKGGENPFTYYNIARGHACFFVGVILKEIYEYVNVEKAREWIANILLVLFVCISVLVFLTQDETKVLASTQPLSQMIWGNVLSPMLIWICIFCKPISKILKVKPLIELGKIATSIYVWHFPCYMLVRIISRFYNIIQYAGSLWFYVAMIIYIIIVGVVSNHIIEPKVNQMVDVLIKKIHKEI